QHQQHRWSVELTVLWPRQFGGAGENGPVRSEIPVSTVVVAQDGQDAQSEFEYLAALAGDAAVRLAYSRPVRVQPAGDSVGPAHAIATQDCGGQHQRSPAALLPCQRAARE